MANAPLLGNVSGVKFSNQAILGVTNHTTTLLNHKNFSLSTQQGLFPKIANTRGEHQSIPNSAHSNTGTNVLKNSGGHISGMSKHGVEKNIYRDPNFKPMSSPRSSQQ
jgi:hypothetical protein